MKILSVIVALCFTLNVFASTNSIHAFESAFDEYNYALTVEWDQQNNEFKNLQTKKLLNTMSDLIQRGELSQADVVAVVEKKLNNKELLEAIKLKIAMAGEAKSNQALVDFLSSSSKDFYGQGANWNGSGQTVAIVAISAVVVLGLAVWFSVNYGCTEYAQTCDTFGCHNDYENCTDYGFRGPHLKNF